MGEPNSVSVGPFQSPSKLARPRRVGLVELRSLGINPSFFSCGAKGPEPSLQVFGSGTRRKGLPKGLERRLDWGVPVRLSPVRALVRSFVG